MFSGKTILADFFYRRKIYQEGEVRVVTARDMNAWEKSYFRKSRKF